MSLNRRRNDKERMKKRAKKLFPNVKCSAKFADNLTPCSCHMCGNPRRHSKGKARLTKQELNNQKES